MTGRDWKDSRTQSDDDTGGGATHDWPGKRSSVASSGSSSGTAWPGKRSITGGLPSAPVVQRKDDPAAAQAAAAPTTSVIVDDNVTPTELQIRRRDFVAKIGPVVKATVSDVLGPVWSVAECPYIDRYMQMYSGRPATEIESFVRKYTGSGATGATQLMVDLAGRVRNGVKQWKESGKLPGDVAAADPDAAKAATSAAPQSVQHKAAGTGGDGGNTPEAVMSALGDGAPIDGSIASRMGGAFGTSFGDVRIHTDEGGAAMAQKQGALAFTVGNHVAFAPGRYNPGSVEGDALLAHELTHVLQQRGETKGGGGGHGAEHDADKGAEAAVKNLHGGASEKASAAMSSDFQLQRCSGSPAETGLMNSDVKGAFLNQKVGQNVNQLSTVGGAPSIPEDIKAVRTLGVSDTEAGAVAIVKTNGKAGAVTVEQNKFVAYETDKGFSYRDETVSIPNTAASIEAHPPKLAPGVIALISTKMITVRAGQFDPGAKEDAQGNSDKAMASTENPFDGYKQGLDAKGDLNNLSDDKLVAAFDAALKDTAIVVLNKSAAQVKEKQERFAGNGANLSATELETMKTTATLLAEDDTKIEASQSNLTSLTISNGYAMSAPVMAGAMPVAMAGPFDKEIRDEQKKLEQLKTQRKIHLAKYPLLSRVDPAKFKDLTKEQMTSQLGGELPGILADIEKTKQNAADGKLNLWEVEQVVDATIAGFGLDDKHRQLIAAKKAEEAKKKTIETIVFTVFAIGFGLAAVFATGGTALFFAAGAFGLSTFDAMRQTEQYGIDKPASNTNLDKDAGFTAPPGWGWLVVAWIGVGLDGLQVASAVGKIAKAEKSIAEAAKELAADAKRLGMTQEELIAKLRQVAGDVDGAAKVSESSKSMLSGKLGLPVEIDPKLVGDVRVYYDVDKATGRAVVRSIAAGPEAHIAEILAHENVINMMRRYEGLTGRLRELWEKLLAIAKRSPKDVNPFPAGSKAYDSWNELYKLPDLVDAQFSKYKGGLKAADEGSLARDIEILEEEARRHRKVVDDMVLEAGEGFVAKTGDSTKAALKAGYPLVDGTTTAEEMLAKGYYYRTSASGGGFDLVRKTEAVGPQLRVENVGGTFKIVKAVEKLESLIPDAAQLARLRAIVTDDSKLALLYDKVKNATRIEALLKGVGNDIVLLDKLFAKVTDAADLERLLKSIPGTKLETLVNGVKTPEQLAKVLESVGDYSGSKMLTQWADKSQFDKIDQFMERLAKSSKELAETSALTGKSIIIDSNTAIALKKYYDPVLKPTMHAGEVARVNYILGLPPGTEIRFGNVVLGEVGADALANIKGIPLSVMRDSADYQKVVSKLEALNVGAGKGAADRALVADAFFAKTDGSVATFITGDKAVYNKLATASGIDLTKLGSKNLFDFTSGGFQVTIEGRTIRVVPLP